MLEALLQTYILNNIATEQLKTEVQVSLCQSQIDIVNQLHNSKLKLKRQGETFFIESRSLSLYQQNWVIRVRVNSLDNAVEVALKNNKSTTDMLATKKCEYDLHDSQKKLACKLVNHITLDEFQKISVRKDYISLLSAEQKDWLQQNQISSDADWQMAGSFIEQSVSLSFNSYEITLDFSKDNLESEYNEISTRVLSRFEIPAQKDLQNFVKAQSLVPCEDQSVKLTLKKLKSFFGLP